MSKATYLVFWNAEDPPEEMTSAEWVECPQQMYYSLSPDGQWINRYLTVIDQLDVPASLRAWRLIYGR